MNVLNGIVADLVRRVTPTHLKRTVSAIEGYGSTAVGFSQGHAFGMPQAAVAPEETAINPLTAYLDAHRDGRGIWEWRRYFDIYHRHCQRFIGRSPRVTEIGIYSGGGLEMWRNYFGQESQIYGVDIESTCRVYASDGVTIIIGDQGDRGFWRHLKKENGAFRCHHR